MSDELLALGMDVSVGHGLDVVVLEGRRALAHPPLSRQELAELGRLLRALHPDVVAIDSPPHFAARGLSRACERELARCGIQCYYTPSEEVAAGNSFFDWMRQGHKVFATAAEAGYPLYRPGEPVRGSAIEVFPHASAVALRGSLPPSGWLKSQSRKASWRVEVLQSCGVATAELASLDLMDAALGALTGLLVLEGCFCTVGDSRPEDGVMVLPTRRLAARYATARQGHHGIGHVERQAAAGGRTRAPPRDKELSARYNILQYMDGGYAAVHRASARHCQDAGRHGHPGHATTNRERWSHNQARGTDRRAKGGQRRGDDRPDKPRDGGTAKG